MTIIRVPKPAAGAFHKHRPVSDLLRWQIRHMHEAEKLLPHDHRTGINIDAIKTEGEASSYIRKVTEKLVSKVHLRHVFPVPRPQQGSMNKERPISQLRKQQMTHFREIEKTWPAAKQTGIDTELVKTEAEAAVYIQKITAMLHPIVRKSAAGAGKG
ncbi:MAG TPA: hypothetical protein VIX19_10455 [Terriglobales bacterium]